MPVNIPPKTRKAALRILQAALPFVTYEPLVDEVSNFLLTGDVSLTDISKKIRDNTKILEFDPNKIHQSTDYLVAWHLYTLTSLTWYTCPKEQQRVIYTSLRPWFKDLKKRVYHEKNIL